MSNKVVHNYKNTSPTSVSMSQLSSDSKAKKSVDDQICPNCQKESKVIWVHGHGQCSECGVNILPCCNGEICYS